MLFASPHFTQVALALSLLPPREFTSAGPPVFRPPSSAKSCLGIHSASGTGSAAFFSRQTGRHIFLLVAIKDIGQSTHIERHPDELHSTPSACLSSLGNDLCCLTWHKASPVPAHGETPSLAWYCQTPHENRTAPTAPSCFRTDSQWPSACVTLSSGSRCG